MGNNNGGYLAPDYTQQVMQLTTLPGRFTPATPIKDVNPFFLGRWMHRQGFAKPGEHANERLRAGWQFEHIRS